MSNLHFFFFAIYPYICLAIFFFGSLVRFDREQYTWKPACASRWKSNR